MIMNVHEQTFMLIFEAVSIATKAQQTSEAFSQLLPDA